MRLGAHTRRLLRLMSDGQWWTAPGVHECLKLQAEENVYTYLRRCHARELIERREADIALWRITEQGRDALVGRKSTPKPAPVYVRHASVWDYAGTI